MGADASAARANERDAVANEREVATGTWRAHGDVADVDTADAEEAGAPTARAPRARSAAARRAEARAEETMTGAHFGEGADGSGTGVPV